MAISVISQNTKTKNSPLLEMGYVAQRSGDLVRARRMLRLAMHEALQGRIERDSLIEIAVGLAGTYFDEVDYHRAEIWYARALNISMLLHGDKTMKAACLLVKLADLAVIQSQFEKSRALFEKAQRIYLLSNAMIEESIFLNNLIDLSWSLCVRRQALDARNVNILISHIKEEQQFADVENL